MATRGGEVVFNTGMVGYEELLSDPSYCGQIVVMTYPNIGNYGINPQVFESNGIQVTGFVVRELCQRPNHWQSQARLEAFLRQAGIPVLAEVDTRALTRKLRQQGTMRGWITTQPEQIDRLLATVEQIPDISEQDLVSRVTTAASYTFSTGLKRVVVMDFGVKTSILRFLAREGCEVVVVPAGTGAPAIRSYRPAGLVLSNGPGNPKMVSYAITTVQELLGEMPILGICLGHQIVALACGADTYKLKFGHRGMNHPVKDRDSGQVYITSQNHGFAVDEASLGGTDLEVTFRNLNDGTVEGLRHKRWPIFTAQFHPEGAPGHLDTCHLFNEFVSLLA